MLLALATVFLFTYAFESEDTKQQIDFFTEQRKYRKCLVLRGNGSINRLYFGVLALKGMQKTILAGTKRIFAQQRSTLATAKSILAQHLEHQLPARASRTLFRNVFLALVP